MPYPNQILRPQTFNLAIRQPYWSRHHATSCTPKALKPQIEKIERSLESCETQLEVGAFIEIIPNRSALLSKQVLHPRQVKSNLLIRLSCKTITCTHCFLCAYSYGVIWSHIPHVSETPKVPMGKIGRRSYLCKRKLEAEIHWLKNKKVINNSYKPIIL